MDGEDREEINETPWERGLEQLQKDAAHNERVDIAMNVVQWGIPIGLGIVSFVLSGDARVGAGVGGAFCGLAAALISWEKKY